MNSPHVVDMRASEASDKSIPHDKIVRITNRPELRRKYIVYVFKILKK